MLDLDADDSSDAEDTATRLEEYDLEASLDNFKDSRKKTSYLTTVDTEGYSFLAYAMGVQLLYSSPVNTAYEEKKKALPVTALETPKGRAPIK